jgi:anti-sigma factor RsiW
MNDLRCSSGVELLMDYLEGVLPGEMRAALEAHVAGCVRCAAFIASYRETPRLVREATAVAIPQGVESSLIAFLRARRRRC